jgi:predicted nucleic acid-binding protein
MTSALTDLPELVVDASALVDLIVSSPLAPQVAAALRGHRLHAPCHVDAEALSALARLTRAGSLPESQVPRCLQAVAAAPLERHPIQPLLDAAWGLRGNLRVLDALYVALAQRQGCHVLTTDSRLAAAAPASARLVTGG